MRKIEKSLQSAKELSRKNVMKSKIQGTNQNKEKRRITTTIVKNPQILMLKVMDLVTMT